MTLVCEEAHRYVPANAALGFEPCKRAIAKIAKEGRKYGALAVHRHAAARRDRPDHPLPVQHRVRAAHVERPRPGDRGRRPSPTPALACSSSCPRSASAKRSHSATAWRCPVRIKFDELPAHCLPRSTTARFTEHWQQSVGDEGFLEQVVEKWRSSDIGAGSDATQHAAMMADGMGIDPGLPAPEPLRPARPVRRARSLRLPRACARRTCCARRRPRPSPQRRADARRARPTPTCAQGQLRHRAGEPAAPRAARPRQPAASSSRCPAPRSNRCATALSSASSVRNRRSLEDRLARLLAGADRDDARGLASPVSSELEIGPESQPRSPPSCARSGGS